MATAVASMLFLHGELHANGFYGFEKEIATAFASFIKSN
jgi:hypothetical protein